MTTRQQRRVFGEVADAYDEVRPGYPVEIARRVAAYLGHTPARIVESGAGTGKGTAVLRTFAAPLTCVEPDPAMAAVLRRRFAGDDLVEVFLGSFENWTPPPGGVELLASAQAWHWVDPTRRNQLAYDALAPAGALAIFGHHYGFAEGPFLDEMDAIYDEIAPEIADPPDKRLDRARSFHHDEIAESGLFADVETQHLETIVHFDTQRYLTLLSTFSGHRMLPEDKRVPLHNALADLIDRHGGVLEHRITTSLWLARKPRP
ncbi:class I SAM-dependent methyltransferase [Allorhizocola rhizosphaerae]|uniref:class I SAM-dependent methyltransferase n=1 Tax=Allorhizocola rhizosphaerae TaxID=1872709 RepID=UPI000E3EA6D3|nr:class I SAM-dependent methyltransferase [Allorhizocola rhizosphaerae]